MFIIIISVQENIQNGNDSGLPAVGNFSLNVTFNKTLSLDFSETIPIRTAFRRDRKSEPLREENALKNDEIKQDS